jgi:hypothetical protein
MQACDDVGEADEIHLDEDKRKIIEARIIELTQRDPSERVTPEAVVDDARDPTSPLHDLFEWDDAVAAHNFRLQVARRIIRTVRIVSNLTESTVKVVRYVRDPRCASDRQGYVSTATLRTREDLAREALANETGRVLACVARLRDVAEALGLSEEVNAVLVAAEMLRVRAGVDEPVKRSA